MPTRDPIMDLLSTFVSKR